MSVRGRLSASEGRLDLAVTDLGPTQLKNIAEPIRVYSLEAGKPTHGKPGTAANPIEKLRKLKKRSRFALLGVAVTALVILAAVGAWHFVGSNWITPTEATRLSIVVLPFKNLGGDPAQDSFADALTDQLTTALARLRDSAVIAHTTALTYKGKPVEAKAIGRELGVRYLLEGSVQPTSDQVRINAQLIDAETGAHLWADQFDVPRADSLQTQDKIVARLARAMYLELPEVETARVKRTPAAKPDAQDLALQCQMAFLKNEVVFASEAIATDSPCERALAADPDNVRALTWSAVKSMPSVGRGSSPWDDLKRADVLLSKALALDPKYAPAHLLNAFMLQAQFRLEEAIAEDRRALDLDPSLADAYWHMGFVMRRLGEFQASVEAIDKAIWLSPHDPFRSVWYADKAGSHLALKQYDQAIESARRAVAVNPNNAGSYFYLPVALALAGQESQAHEALERYLALPGARKTMATWKRVRPQLVNADSDPRYVQYYDLLFGGLRKAGMPEG